MNLKTLVFIINIINSNVEVSYHKQVKKINHKNHHLNINRHSDTYELSLSQNKDKNYYFITLQISDKKIPVQFLIDTGSSLLWMPNKKCLDHQKKQFCGKFLQKDNYGYLDGSISGDIIVTNIYINYETVNKNSVIMLTTHQDKNVEDPIIGLSYSSTIYPTFMEKMKQNGLIEKIAFTIDMKNQKLIFGTINKEREIVDAKFTGFGEFIVDVQQVQFNGEIISIKKMRGLMDSGNTLISIPSMFQTKFVDILKKKNLDCKIRVEDNPSFSQLYCKLDQGFFEGSFSVQISGHQFVLTNNDLLETCSDEQDSEEDLSQQEENKKFEGYCAMSIEFHSEFSQQTIILGDPFLRKYMATFDLDDKIIKFDISEDKIKAAEKL